MRRRLSAAIAGAALLALGGLAGCEDRSYRDIGAQVRVLAERTDALVATATARLVRFGRRAIPQIETALHTARPSGKVNLVRALEAIGEPEAAAILRHFAVYDPEPEVRAACEEALGRWASGTGPAADAARRALARVAEKRAAGEAPVVVGQGGK